MKINHQTPNAPIGNHTGIKYLIGVLPRVLNALLLEAPNQNHFLNINVNPKETGNVTDMEPLTVSDYTGS